MLFISPIFIAEMEEMYQDSDKIPAFNNYPPTFIIKLKCLEEVFDDLFALRKKWSQNSCTPEAFFSPLSKMKLLLPPKRSKHLHLVSWSQGPGQLCI